MFELRRLRLQEKPVTTCDQKYELEAMLNQRQVERERTPAADHREISLAKRPEAIMVEIQGLVEKRPVSTILASQESRRNLEEAVESARARARAPFGGTRPVNGLGSHIPHSSRRNSLPVASWRALSNDAQTVSAPTGIHDHSNDRQDREQWRHWNMNEMQSDTLTTEIRDLIQQHVVTLTLESEFRGELELHVQDRLQRSGGNGEDVQRFIRSLGQSERRPTLHHLHPAGAEHELSREIRLMKTEMQELKRMVRLSFELQLDVQRAIRQEVAAIVNAGLNGHSPDTPTTAIFRSATVASAGPCVICSDHVVDTLLYKCGHMCVCYRCAMELKSQQHNCPFCRAPIDDVVRAYQCQ